MVDIWNGLGEEIVTAENVGNMGSREEGNFDKFEDIRHQGKKQVNTKEITDEFFLFFYKRSGKPSESVLARTPQLTPEWDNKWLIQ
ncbi:hypothetical protein E2C01_023352 [Portunus trituberculatus]|uniref:Uncharacterized protein n=1 Tax=Portunus trituberculatus TaxID=210409 RepID=A0A5B7E9R9_PORTR|nr:hypothetical protein [Portunus trituberculatus]